LIFSYGYENIFLEKIKAVNQGLIIFYTYNVYLKYDGFKYLRENILTFFYSFSHNVKMKNF